MSGRASATSSFVETNSRQSYVSQRGRSSTIHDEGDFTGSRTESVSNAPASSTNNPHIRIVPHIDSTRALTFDVVDREVPEGLVLKIGRFTEKGPLEDRITFKSKVVSRQHAEIWVDKGQVSRQWDGVLSARLHGRQSLHTIGIQFYLRDTKSSSGTFLNHVRISPPNSESKPFLLKDGDVIQLGVDYQGGNEGECRGSLVV